MEPGLCMECISKAITGTQTPFQEILKNVCKNRCLQGGGRGRGLHTETLMAVYGAFYEDQSDCAMGLSKNRKKYYEAYLLWNSSFRGIFWRLELADVMV